jgi:serine/threonine protein kinase
MLLSDGARHVLLDAEFGVIRHILDSFTALKERTSPAEGSSLDAAYLAPELSLATDEVPVAQPPGDIYSFAMVLFEMATGRAPFLASAEAPFGGLREPQLLACVMAGVRPPIPDTVPPPLARLIAACWAEDPAARPSAREVLALLATVEAELEGTPQPSAAPVAAVRVVVPKIGGHRGGGGPSSRGSLQTLFPGGGA